jgi:hypothetical protein
MAPNEQAVALNHGRASDAEKAVLAFARTQEHRPPESLDDSCQDREEWLLDLLSDLRHWAREKGLEFDEAVRVSEMHFEAEVDEEAAREGGE